MVVMKLVLVFALFTAFPDLARFSSITQGRITELVNQARAENGLAPLRINPTLQQVAQLKLDDMIANGYFAHSSPSGIDPWYWFKKAGYLYTYAGENLAMNFIEAEEVSQAWLASPTHRANIMNPNYQEIGIAVGVGVIDGFESTIVVQMFGTSFAPPKLVKKPKPPKAPVVVKGEKTSAPTKESRQTSNKESTGASKNEPKVALLVTPSSGGGTTANAPRPDTIDVPDSVNTVIPFEETVGVINDQASIREVTLTEPAGSGVTRLLVKYARIIPFIIIVFVIIALLLKVFIRYHIQHRRVIIHAIIIILLGLILLWLNIHFLEPVGGSIILG